MKNLCVCFILLLCQQSLLLHAQDRGPWVKYVDRLEGFGKMIPQEKVYLHLDNTCYFIGDIIWFKAYLRQTNTDKPSTYSGTLYVELLNNDGYLVERKIVEMKEGEGDGYFWLRPDSTTYAGFYEIRAYTRWQLNWGEYEHEHAAVCKEWFLNKTMQREFFRDYEKLYSRVFPVYNKPIEPGEYNLDMTMRPLQRFYKPDDKAPKLTLTLFPEGGNLVAGVPNRVAYEAQRADGEYLKGRLVINENETAPVLNRGRGVFEITPEKGMERSVEFVTEDSERVKAKLPKAEDMGVALSVQQEGDEWVIHPHVAGLPIDSLALTVMHEGKLSHFKAIRELTNNSAFRIPNAALQTGVNQVTVFDTEGRVWADRLFFVASDKPIAPTINITGTKNVYDPYEPIKLDVQSTAANASNVSLAVREARGAIRNYDTGNILTEMLLSSEIRGFVPDPCWFFKADDIEHRQALDLLMMTQGWRRFNWKDMAVKGEWEFVHPAEKVPMLSGNVRNYQAFMRYDPTQLQAFLVNYYQLNPPEDFGDEVISKSREQIVIRKAIELIKTMARGYEYTSWRQFRNAIRSSLTGEDAAALHIITDDVLDQVCTTFGIQDKEYGNTYKSDKLKRDVLVHYELMQKGSENSVEADVETKDGRFLMKLPRFYDYSSLFLAASDTTKWNKKDKKGKGAQKKHQWIVPNEEEFPEFSVHLNHPYPRFTKPFNWYQEATVALDTNEQPLAEEEDSIKGLSVVQVKGKKHGTSGFRYAVPAVALDANEAFNLVADAGLMNACFRSASTFSKALAHYYAADMGDIGNYKILTAYDDIQKVPMNTTAASLSEGRNAIYGNNPDWMETESNYLRNLDSVFIYTDYAPRLESGMQFKENADAMVTVLLKRYKDDSVRRTYRDRHILLQGFAQPSEFYNPDYSRQTPPEGETKDYRRTLYWNPRLKLDEQGRAHITLYNNSRQTTIVAEAEGQSPDGQLLWSK